MRTFTVIAGALVFALAPLDARPITASEPADALASATPCPLGVQATSVPGDPNAAVVRIAWSAPEPGGTLTAYGATTRWSGTLDRFASVRMSTLYAESSVTVRAGGPIEAIVYQPPHSRCLAHAVVREPKSYDGPDVERSTVTLGNPVAIGPISCAQRYAPPRTVLAVEPRTPPIAMQQKISGTVQVLVTINDRGEPTKAVIQSSPSAVLNAPSIDAALRSTFSPEIFRCHGVPGAYIFSVSYNA